MGPGRLDRERQPLRTELGQSASRHPQERLVSGLLARERQLLHPLGVPQLRASLASLTLSGAQAGLRRPCRVIGGSCHTVLAATNKCLAQSNKSSGRVETTKGRPTEVSPATSNILKAIDLADRAIRRAVFAVIDAAEHRVNRKGSEPLLRMQERGKHQVRVFIGDRP